MAQDVLMLLVGAALAIVGSAATALVNHHLETKRHEQEKQDREEERQREKAEKYRRLLGESYAITLRTKIDYPEVDFFEAMQQATGFVDEAVSKGDIDFMVGFADVMRNELHESFEEHKHLTKQLEENELRIEKLRDQQVGLELELAQLEEE